MKNLVLTLGSIWSWFVLAVCVVVWLPLMAIVWLVTAPFDPPRYWTGFLFRKLTVVHLMVNPLWTFRTGGVFPPAGTRSGRFSPPGFSTGAKYAPPCCRRTSSRRLSTALLSAF